MCETATKIDLDAALRRLIDQGLTFSHCTQAFRATTPDELLYVEKAQEDAKEGDLEIDNRAVVSEGEDPGAYVMAWVWVSDSEIWEGATDSDGDPCRTRNFYRCTDESVANHGHEPVEWEDDWSCACNDECPECGAEIEPYESVELDLKGNPIEGDVP